MSMFFNFYRYHLDKSFNSPTSEEFFHYLAKHKSQHSIYEESKLSERIKQITEKLGSCSFDIQKSGLKVSPLQVAYIYGNPAAIKYLESKSDSKIKDYFGRTIEDYKKYSAIENAFCKLPVEPRDFQAIERLIPKPVSLTKAPFTYKKFTNDFGQKISSLFFSGPTPKNHSYLGMTSIIANMKSISEKEGFTILSPSSNCWPRDHCLFLGKDKLGFVITDQVELSKQAQERSESLLIATNSHIPHELIPIQRGMSTLKTACSANLKPILELFIEKHPNDLIPIPLGNLEGGNYFLAHNSKGKKKGLIGLVHLYATHMELRLGGYFKTNPPPKLNTKLSEEEIRRGAEQMYHLGILKLNDKSGLLSKEILKKINDEKNFGSQLFTKSVYQFAIDNNWLTPFSITETDLMRARPLVENYFAEQQASKVRLAELLQMPLEDLHFVPPVEFHLDIFMLPGPKGSIFLQDPTACAEMLKPLKYAQHMKGLGLSYSDITPITEYLVTTLDIEKAITPRLNKVKKVLQEAQFTIIPTPGIFQVLGVNDYPGNINFINASTGFSQKTQRYFYITQGAQVPGSQLGKALMILFEKFLKSYVPNIDVYFVGQNPQNKEDFSEAMQLWNMNEKEELGGFGGVHCLSTEGDTQDHTD